jgi:hypothetical protein
VVITERSCTGESRCHASRVQSQLVFKSTPRHVGHLKLVAYSLFEWTAKQLYKIDCNIMRCAYGLVSYYAWCTANSANNLQQEIKKNK